MKIKAFIERGNDGTYGVYVDLDDNNLNYGIIGNGATVAEAIEDFKACYDEMKELHKEQGKRFVDAEFEYSYDVASFLAYYSGKLSLAGLGRLTGINRKQLSHYVSGNSKPTAKTIEKIEKSLHDFASELSQLHFT